MIWATPPMNFLSGFPRERRLSQRRTSVNRVCARVLIAEDDPMQAELVRRYLERDGHVGTVVRDGHAALAQVLRDPPDLLVLDVMLPGISGIDVCRRLRAESGLPVLMLTARVTEDDLLLGLDSGADDYLTKPYSPRELAARARTLLRRVARAPDRAEQVVRVAELTLDPARRQLTVAGRVVECTRGEFEILYAMARHPGQVFTRRQLLERTSRFDGLTSERTVDVHVMNLRRKIEADPHRPAYLVTVFGTGYKLLAGPAGGA
jgi:DNA-binding response OmpR family regulator